MTWITAIPPGEAQGELGTIYETIRASRGGVAAVHQAQSLNPRALRAHLELYKAVVFQRSSLGRIDRERIAVVVSCANQCTYCVAHHGAALRSLGEDKEIADALSAGTIPDDLSAGHRALLEWAVRGARVPAKASAADIATLRAAGFDDRAILDAALTIAYFSFVNRIVLLLGVDLERDFERTCADMDGG